MVLRQACNRLLFPTGPPENALRNPCMEAPNFYPEGFGQFLSGNRIWVLTWSISIRTLDLAYFFSLDTVPELNFLRFIHLRYYGDIVTI